MLANAMTIKLSLYSSRCLVIISLLGCEPKAVWQPVVITEKVPHDTDDPAIWINHENPEESIIFGTDKETGGGIYAFDLNGKIISEKCILDIQRPNNIDLEMEVMIDGEKKDIIAFTERERMQIRVFSVPDMTPLDNGGFPVFEGEPGESNLPMGIAIYKNPETGKTSVIVSRKTGPKEGYLWQYALNSDSTGLRTELLRKFGTFSGLKEIEAIAVDDELGYVYYSDEGFGVRKYYADPEAGNEQVGEFGKGEFKDDIEGIALLSTSNNKGYIFVSDQQEHALRIYTREDNVFVKSVPYLANETDGLEVANFTFSEQYPKGLLVAMSDDQTFHYYSLKDLGLE